VFYLFFETCFHLFAISNKRVKKQKQGERPR
jgi:hypothetical protein